MGPYEKRWNSLVWKSDLSAKRDDINVSFVLSAEENADDTLCEQGLPGRGEPGFAAEAWHEAAYDTYEYLNGE